jgi:glycosyltransferase involved in cell wall biosynthesis
MMPDYRQDNPYQSLLAESLAACGVDVAFPVGYRRGLPLYRGIRDNRPIEVLHLHWTEAYTRDGHWLNQVGRWAKLLLDLSFVQLSGVKVVWTLHNLVPHECRFPRLERFFRRRLVRRVSHVLVHGEQSRRAVTQELRCPSDKTTIAPHGNYRSIYPTATPEMRREGRIGLADDHRVFLFFGMVRPYKGLERLLRVWRKLQPSRATLRIVGPCLDPIYEALLRSLVGQTPGATFSCGFVQTEQVSRVFAAADLAVLPFENVQTSGSAILALTFGKPVIAPSLGEIPEALDPATDLLYEPGSDTSLEQAIRRGLEGDLADFGRKSATACERLGWERSAERTTACYRQATRPVGSNL